MPWQATRSRRDDDHARLEGRPRDAPDGQPEPPRLDVSPSDALAEAAALAPADGIIRHTLEIRHTDLVDEIGEADSLWLVAETENLTAPLETDAPVKGGQWVTFTALAFSFALMPI